MPSLDGAFRSLFETNMGIRDNERVLVFSDTIRPDEQISGSDRDRRLRLNATARQVAAFAAKTYGSGAFVEFPATPASGAEPPRELWQTTFGDETVAELERSGLLAKLLAKQASPDEVAAGREIFLAHKESVADIIIALSNNSTSHTRYRALAQRRLAGGQPAALRPGHVPQLHDR